MGKRIVFIFLSITIIILFGALYFLGFMNLMMKETEFFNRFKWLDFGAPIISIFYLILLSIFFIVVLAIMIRLIISLKQDNIKLTTTNIDEFSIKTDTSADITSSVNKLSSTLNKNINLMDQYSKNIEKDIEHISKIEEEINFQEKIDSIYQNFSQMISDIIECVSVSELFEKILFWGANLSHSKRGSLMVVDKNKELYVYKTIGWTTEEKANIKNIRIPLGSGIAGKVASENKRIFVTNIENYDGYDFKYKDKYETKSFISLPIFGLQRVVAVLNLTDNKNGFYSISDLESLNIITAIGSKIFELVQIKKRI
ncbi:MAG TPA: GAF domain-containing protein [Spirochaetota bacterium]|nr:GAF domain-containing protein [Spirochaetota bacterium]HOL56631.1 GAF domain-containing protein [Spirochaetota bacterium]HPP03744.1 GAF domain-containing protein [Spirochaetota bacterium]